jgi:hypothetical protein
MIGDLSRPSLAPEKADTQMDMQAHGDAAMNRWTLRLRTILLLGALGGLSACTSTRPGSPVLATTLAPSATRRVLVLAVLGNGVSRQAVEDELVRQLAAAGVDAVPGHRVTPDTGDLSARRLGLALAGCEANVALVCHWLSVEQKIRVQAALSSVNQIAYAQTLLLDGRTRRTLWSTRTRTAHPGGFREAAPAFAKAGVEALLEEGALTRASQGGAVGCL